jgi:DnaJ homolog subfamily C member 27
MQKQISIKIISVGNQEVGKSCIIKRYCEERFIKRYIPTIGVDYGVKKVNIHAHTVAIHFFDLSGNDDFKIIRHDFYQNAQVFFLFFLIGNRDVLWFLIWMIEKALRICRNGRLR